MFKKLSNAMLGMSLAFVSILPMQFVNSLVKAEETEKFIIVDDTETDSSQEHYFTYLPENKRDDAGVEGWSDKGDAKQATEPHAKTQHWVWVNGDTQKARSYTYEFTFVGTGVELWGTKNDSKNVFQLDGEQEVVNTYSNSGVIKLYEKKNLDYKKHTVKVSLPNENGVTGLQVGYAKVFGAKENTDKPRNIKTSINPTVQEGVNCFKFTNSQKNEWVVGNGEAYIDFKQNSADAENSYYEVNFIGNKIEIEASKSHNHGKVEFTVDGNHQSEVDLYAPSRQNNQIVYTVSGLEDGKRHTLKAKTLSSKNQHSSSIVNQVTKAHIYHAPYALENLEVETPVNLIREAEHKLNVTFDPVYADVEELKFESENADIASVNEKGIVTAHKAGKTKIHVSAKGVDSKTVEVNVAEQVKAMSGSIVDENLQWTQTKREEVSKMGTTSKHLSAWQADKAVAEFVVYAKQSSLKNVTLSVSDFTDGKNTISKEKVSATFIKSTKAYQGMPGWGYQPDKYPVENGTNRAESSDIMYTTNPVNISYDKVQPVWVEVNVPKGTPAGVYTGTVKVKSEDIKDSELSFTFNVKVRDVELPDVSTYKDTFDIELWQYPYSSAEYYGLTPFSKEHLEVLKSNMEIYKGIGGHAITTTISEDAWSAQTYSTKAVHYPSMVKWKLVKGQFNGKEISDDFEFEYDFTDFDKWVQFNKDLGIGDKIVLYSIAPWHNSFKYWVGNELKTTPYVVGSKTYQAVYKNFFTAMVNHLDEKGWFDDAYVGIDERGLKIAALDLIDSVKNKDGKSLKTAGAMDGIDKDKEHEVLARRIDDLNVGDTVVQTKKEAFDQLLKERKALGKRTTLYSCTGHIPGNFSLSAPAESYWSMMYAYKNGTAGFLRWAYDAWVENPLEDATHSSFEAGDCFLIYPDHKESKNRVSKSSLRLEKMAQGVRDINKLIMMQKEYPQLKEDVDQLLKNVQTRYEQSGYYLTENGKKVIAKDMNTVHDGIDAITDKYLALREKDNIAKARQDLADLLESSKSNLDKADEFTKESFNAFKEAYENAEKLLKDDKVTLSELRNAITALQEKIDGLTLKEEVNPTPKPEEKPNSGENTPADPDGNKPEQGKPNVPSKPEIGEKPNTGVSTNTILLWTLVFGAGIATITLAKTRKKVQK